MISLLSEKPVRRTQVTSTSSAQRRTVSTSLDLVPILHLQNMEQEHQLRISGLQQYVCELLLRNQQLRMALMERNAKETGDGRGK